MNEREQLHARLGRREHLLRSLFDKLRRQIDEGSFDGTEPGRAWLDGYCVGKGVQMCCGDWSLGDSIGVDMDYRKVALDIWGQCDRIPEYLLPLDYIVTNYLEAFDSPLHILRDWHAYLRPQGVLAIVCRDAEMYAAGLGPLENAHRQSVFTETVLRCYLTRAGFEIFRMDRDGKELRVAARRR